MMDDDPTTVMYSSLSSLSERAASSVRLDMARVMHENEVSGQRSAVGLKIASTS